MFSGVDIGRTLRVALLSGVFDAPARAAVQTFVQYNGFFGCSTCTIEGESRKTKKGGSKRVFPFEMSAAGPGQGNIAASRSHEDTIAKSKEAFETGKSVCGVKNPSWLITCPGFNIIRGVTVDYMHTVCLGVMKLLLTLWTGTEHKGKPYSVFSSLSTLEDRLSAIQPPNRVGRLPKPLAEVKDWKASEYRAFLLFYGLPCLRGILPDDYHNHFSFLVRGIYILLGDSISEAEIERAGQDLKQFYATFSELYGEHGDLETMNIHSLMHLAEKVEDLGPLWTHSCFFLRRPKQRFQIIVLRNTAFCSTDMFSRCHAAVSS